MSSKAARTYILLSIAASLVTMGLKFGAYQLTSSVGLFSDMAESSVNLIAALAAFWALTVAAQPPDKEHTFGHSKAEYFSSGLEGLLILVAAITIAITAIPRILDPQPIAELELGLGLSILSSLVNAGVAWVLLRAGKRLRSITLRADAHHLLTDVWTSVGVVAGLVIVKLTGWLILDPIMALLVAINIVWVSIKLIRETMSGLMDSALPESDQAVIRATLTAYQAQGIQFHALRTRVAGARNFVSFHVLVPGNWSVQKGHELCDVLEQAIMTALPGTHVMTHLEPIEDPVSWEDAVLDRSHHP
ncbi:cation transporter [Acaryochloris sp. 'Moss Beach']|uniref:cation diffusion facilitator family transporter n=1 Tax=Acaryochloris TaxID=155977 RepID=UPI001BB0818C|nr:MULTISPECIES: cation diffusion facilitator family transporter [Acaryochloris]QUY43506.1 cation transporter [Acaryochloris marina S15]UJB68316.1 cation transporter [Acaryochloris sp. 'Moss Beach']